MAQGIFQFEIDGFDRLAAVLRPELMEKLMKRHIGRATGQNAAYLAKMMRMTIRNQGSGLSTAASIDLGNGSIAKMNLISPNKLLTINIKGSSKPLVDSGDLFQSITYEKIDTYTAFAGVLRSSGGFSVAQIVHDGVKLPVTPQMRGMFILLSRATAGTFDPARFTGRAAALWARNQLWFPLKPSTTTIQVAGRPFVTLTMGDPKIQAKMRENWEYALATVFADIRRSFYSK
jgi:hypothetical protein